MALEFFLRCWWRMSETLPIYLLYRPNGTAGGFRVLPSLLVAYVRNSPNLPQLSYRMACAAGGVCPKLTQLTSTRLSDSVRCWWRMSGIRLTYMKHPIEWRSTSFRATSTFLSDSVRCWWHMSGFRQSYIKHRIEWRSTSFRVLPWLLVAYL